jgi:hypothetical protein
MDGRWDDQHALPSLDFATTLESLFRSIVVIIVVIAADSNRLLTING